MRWRSALLWVLVGAPLAAHAEVPRELDVVGTFVRRLAPPPPRIAVPTGGEELGVLTTLGDGTPVSRRRTQAARRRGAIDVDGDLSDAAWRAAPATRVDWQQVPAEGSAATGPADFRVLFDDEAIYIGVHAQDPAPAQIAGLLFRPFGFDKVNQSDWIIVTLAPSADRNIGYAFAVNPSAVKIDYRVTRQDSDETYAAIWDAATRRDATGWYVEYRVPFSQMRVEDGYHESWGLQIERKWSRNLEKDFWSPYPETWSQELLAMGDLVVRDRLSPGRPIEIVPYVVGGARLQTVAPGDPFHDATEPAYAAGADAKVQLTSGLRLAASFNPDFGQIEADPAEVNLTDRETFFTERRPLFIEDADLYDQPIGTAQERLFYSRRIGARPHFTPRGDFVDTDDVTTIYGAAKLSGFAPGGVRVGILSALGARETARAQLPDEDPGDGIPPERVEEVTEPTTLYNVAQLGRTFRGGATDVRLTATNVHRFLGDIEAIPRDAYTGAGSAFHQFADGAWALSLLGSGSYLAGEPLAIALQQRSSRRYFQRPDATHVELDPARTSLTGYAFGAKVAKTSGTWLGSLAVDGRSPGYELNDVGFLLDADYLNASASLAWQRIVKRGRLRKVVVTATAQAVSDFAPDQLRQDAALQTDLTTRKRWGISAGAGVTRQVLDTRLLRGGPAVRGTNSVDGFVTVSTDQTAPLRLRLDANGVKRPASDSYRARAQLLFGWDILPNLEISIGPRYTRVVEDTLYLGTLADGMDMPHYLVGRIAQHELVAQTRINYTISPKLTLQLYAEPFLNAGKFRRFQEAADVRATAYRDRFRTLSVMEQMGQLDVDTDGDGTPDLSFERPDYTFTSLLSNVVVRWEFRPGSSAYLIWSQSRLSEIPGGDIGGDDFKRVFTNESVHVVLLKLSYWMNL